MALAARLLKRNGELVAITPRSFCNGLYFRGFRHWYFEHVVLDHIHIFESRTETFKHSNVLQESIVTKAHRLGKPLPTIAVTASFRCQPRRRFATLRGSGYVTLLITLQVTTLSVFPEGKEDREIMQSVESLPLHFSGNGPTYLNWPVGPVSSYGVPFGRHKRENRLFPCSTLTTSNHSQRLGPWQRTGNTKRLGGVNESLRLLVPTRNYVLIKRFSSKEEKRRLTASLPAQGGSFSFPYLGIENHVNYVYHGDRELTEDEVYGIAALFNSSLIDRYFRTISGNTQVNATEIRAMNFPGPKDH